MTSDAFYKALVEWNDDYVIDEERLLEEYLEVLWERCLVYRNQSAIPVRDFIDCVQSSYGSVIPTDDFDEQDDSLNADDSKAFIAWESRIIMQINRLEILRKQDAFEPDFNDPYRDSIEGWVNWTPRGYIEGAAAGFIGSSQKTIEAITWGEFDFFLRCGEGFE